MHIQLNIFSTFSAILNSVSGILYTDFVRNITSYRHTERKASMIMRSIIVLIGAASIGLGFVVEKSTSLFQVMFTLLSLTNSAVCGVFALALFYPRASQKASLKQRGVRDYIFK